MAHPHRLGLRWRGRTAGAAVLLASALAGCAAGAAGTNGAKPSTGSTPTAGSFLHRAVPAAVAELPLVDQTGRSVTLASLRGSTVVLADFLTLCQEICPLTSADFRQIDDAVRAAGVAAKVRLVELTVDPQRDTPARLTAYQKLFGIRPNWSFLTGSSAVVSALWRWFGVAYSRTAEPAGPRPRDWWTGHPLTYDVSHQDIVFILGPDGSERWLVDGTPIIPGPSTVPSTLQSFLNEDGRANETAPPQLSWSARDVERALGQVLGHRLD